MKGTRPLDNDEIRSVSTCFTGIFIVKGKEHSRAVPVNIDGRDAIADLIAWHRERYRTTRTNRPLFPSRNQRGSIAMHRQTAHEMLTFITAGLNGKLATHSLRKSFAQRVYEYSGDIYLVQELFGPKSVATTQKYIGINYATAREAVESMALGHEPYRTLLCHLPSRKTPMNNFSSNSHFEVMTSHSSRAKKQRRRSSKSDSGAAPFLLQSQ